MLILALALTAAAPTDVNASDYLELAPGSLLPPILAELKNTLADPYSLRDFTLCPARGIKLKAGKPVSWSVMIAFNAKNSFGGYAGRETYAVVFKSGVIRGGLVSAQFGGSEGIEGLLNSITAKKIANCPHVSDDEIQRLLSSEASPLKSVR